MTVNFKILNMTGVVTVQSVTEMSAGQEAPLPAVCKKDRQ